MLLYSYHVIDADGNNVSSSAYSKMTSEQKQTLSIQVRRHISGSKVRVLSLVGGGIRGYMLGKVLEEIEKVTGKNIAQLFDCIVGTSTGVPIAYALSYPKEVAIQEIMENPKLSEPHAALPKFPAEMITKIYSHYGPYIFANPALRRVLNPFIKGKVDGKTYISEKELDEQIEHEGAVIKILAPLVTVFPSIQEAYKEFEKKIQMSQDLLEHLLCGTTIDPTILKNSIHFLKTFILYPLNSTIKNKIMEVLQKYVTNPIFLAGTDVTLEYTISNFHVMHSVSGIDITFYSNMMEIIEECKTELKNYYLTPLTKIQDCIADYKKFCTTLFDKSAIEEVIKRFIPSNTQLQHLLGCTIGVGCIRDTLEPKFFDNLNPDTRTLTAHKVILGCISAQTYFPSEELNGEAIVDAGTAAKNPSQAALVLASQYFPDCQIEVFEIGTGRTCLPNMEHPHKLTRILNPSDAVWMVMDAGAHSTHTIMELMAKTSCSSLQYLPINFDLGEEIYLDKTTPEYFAKMSESIKKFMQDNDPSCKAFFNALNLSENTQIVPTEQFGISRKFLRSFRHCFSSVNAYRKQLLAQHTAALVLQNRMARIVNREIIHYTPKLEKLRQAFFEAYKKYSTVNYPTPPVPCYPLGQINAWGGLSVSLETLKQGNEVPILSIDGGGTRGIWPLKVLEYIEQSTGIRIANLFPVRGGTSVGGLISIILSIPGPDGQSFYTASDVAKLLENAEQIFPIGFYKKSRNLLDQEKGVMFDNSGLRAVLRKLVRQAGYRNGLKMKDLLGGVGVLTFDNKTLQSIFISKHSHPDLDIVEVGVCTASAPVYLPDNSLPIDGQTIKTGDGGIPDNNPVWYVYAMFNTLFKNSQARILSLGTGFYPDAHPKRDELPFWVAPAALLGFGMDSRTIYQNRLMEIYAKTSRSNISDFCRLQWILPTEIDLTSSLPVVIPLGCIPECLPIGYSGFNKIVEFKDLATVMAAIRMNQLDFINFMSRCKTTPIHYTTDEHLSSILVQQSEKFNSSWATRIATSISLGKMYLDFIDPQLKRNLLTKIYRICAGIILLYDKKLQEKSVTPHSVVRNIDYVVLVSNITKEAIRLGLNNSNGTITTYLNKIDSLLKFLNKKIPQEGILKFIYDEIKKIHDKGYYNETPEIFLACLIVNIMKFMNTYPEIHEWIDYAERQTYNHTFLHKLANLAEMLPRSIAEPVARSFGFVGLKCLVFSAKLTNMAYATYARSNTAIIPNETVAYYATTMARGKEKDTEAMANFLSAQHSMVADICIQPDCEQPNPNQMLTLPEELIFVPIIPDGNCFYNAVLLHLNGTGHSVDSLRNMVATEIENNIEEYQKFIAPDLAEAKITVKQYADKVKNSNEWAGDLEISILSKLLKRSIFVLEDDHITDRGEFNTSRSNEPIFVFYNGIDHYSGLILQQGITGVEVLAKLNERAIKPIVRKLSQTEIIETAMQCRIPLDASAGGLDGPLSVVTTTRNSRVITFTPMLLDKAKPKKLPHQAIENVTQCHIQLDHEYKEASVINIIQTIKGIITITKITIKTINIKRMIGLSCSAVSIIYRTTKHYHDNKEPITLKWRQYQQEEHTRREPMEATKQKTLNVLRKIGNNI